MSNIDKIFSATNKNPTLDTIQKIAQVLECSIDDFIEYEIPPESPVYIDRKTKDIVEIISKDEYLKNLTKEFVNLKKEDIELIEKIVIRLKNK